MNIQIKSGIIVLIIIAIIGSWIFFDSYSKRDFLSFMKSSVKPNGTYVCSKLQNSGPSGNPGLQKAIVKLATNEMGLDCIYQEFIFKGESTVTILTMGIEYPTSYVMDDSIIRIKTDKSDLLLDIRNDSILIGEGYAEGIYKKIRQ